MLRHTKLHRKEAKNCGISEKKQQYRNIKEKIPQISLSNKAVQCK